jgi:hypothetical protein
MPSKRFLDQKSIRKVSSIIITSLIGKQNIGGKARNWGPHDIGFLTVDHPIES